MKLKIGDKVYCKKNCILVSEVEINYCLTINKCYILSEVHVDIIYIIDDDGDPSTFWLKENHLYNLYDWFYTEKELRKLKLEEIESR